MTTSPINRTQNGLIRAAQTVITIAFPVVLVLLAARLVMTPLFLRFEYNRADFPPDPYGFTQADRLEYAPYALNYLLNGAGIDYLGSLTFSDGSSLYEASELRHMHDVKIVTQAAFGVAVTAGLMAVVAGIYLLGTTRRALVNALFSGSLLTLGIVAAIIVVAIFSWDSFFVTFHELFFQNGTWYFPTSDTLIRLFPEQFWFDASLVIGGITVVTSLVVFIVTLRVKTT